MPAPLQEHERSELSQRLSDREREYEERRGHKFLRKDEFKQYAAELREKTAKYKEMKADLNEIRQEVAVSPAQLHTHTAHHEHERNSGLDVCDLRR